MGDFELGVIGGGNMAEAILRGVTGRKFLFPDRIVVSDPSPERREAIASLGIRAVEDNAVAAAQPRLLLATKPQVLGEVLEEVAPQVDPEAVVISIAAGIRTGWIDEKLNRRGRIVRAMPNTPMLIGAGMSAVCPGPRAGDGEQRWVEKLLAASGRVVFVTEEMMDAVTAVSGSGPAYFFYLVEAMIEAGIAEGLPPSVAATLAETTCAGAGAMLINTSDTPQELRRKVTSPGGTTQRAIETMDADGLQEKLTAAVRAAADRSRELGE
ncbi:MAG: pyrroline-5-carboxylate reductase [Phycisphaerae bacterium]